eukprot:GHRR01025119.1.p1 GENE.GHRR01025119.1~~GHRR01025119.1.p1  ORF type:complete len:136 (+),score=34.52 GHRR01025119.1:402-809(+)
MASSIAWIVAFVLLLVRAARAQVLGDVFIYTNNYTFDPFPDLPADFGPEVPDEGIDGYLRVADPDDACQPFTYNVTHETWIALISRSQQQHPSNCTFDVKVGLQMQRCCPYSVTGSTPGGVSQLCYCCRRQSTLL